MEPPPGAGLPEHAPAEGTYTVAVGKGDDGDAKRNPDPERLTQYERSSIRLQVGMLVATGIYALFAILLWCETSRSVEVTRRSLEVSRRSWLVVDELPKVEGGAPPRAGQKIEISFKNTGATPATYVYVSTNMITVESGEFPRKPSYRTDLTSQGVVGPGQPVFVSNQMPPFRSPEGSASESQPTPAPDSLASKIWKDVEEGRTTFFYYGWVQYWDEFGTERGLLFCSRYSAKAKAFSYCGTHNVPW